MAGGLTVTVADTGIRQVLQQLAQRTNDLDPALHAIGAILESAIRQRFETRKDPNRQAWAPHAASTAKRYARQDRHPKTGQLHSRGTLLQRTGEMLDSLNYQVEGQSVLIGFGKPYAAYHEFGTQRMPRRGMLLGDPITGTLGLGDEGEVVAILQRFIEGGAR
ncbi:phage virion morphogenesis protein [Parachitinimonas caeni]|uniref:Phage virion morphogenesis protein n=1 Tax=Parachitinimonas caeni TaxID=3031301 RepID=A0ABT7DWP5_9NEIS|nr:phage virion morphogenesis protein [Parachitinimonas caeni]MDK2124483.1 phage virion morphogenesis protein [Parachitinimonas caeni]